MEQDTCDSTKRHLFRSSFNLKLFFCFPLKDVSLCVFHIQFHVTLNNKAQIEKLLTFKKSCDLNQGIFKRYVMLRC